MMKRLIVGLIFGGLVVGAMALPAEAHRWHRHHDQGHGRFLSGFLAGAVAGLILDALVPPPVVREPRYYYRGMICQDVLVPGHWELRSRQDNGFTIYYPVWIPGYWQRECY